MKLTTSIKLLPTDEQEAILRETLIRVNEACNDISAMAWARLEFNRFRLHHLTYRHIRETFGLPADVACCCIGKVAHTYKGKRNQQHLFHSQSGQPFSPKVFRFVSDTEISISTVRGRLAVRYECGDNQRPLLKAQRGEVDLVLRGRTFYLMCVYDVEERATQPVEDYLGVDLGITNIATDSRGANYSGEKVNENRSKYGHRRRNLQRKRTRSATRKLRKLSGRQRRYQRDTNHCISKAIVADAKRYGCGIALEDLKGIRKRIKASRRQRARLHSWAFYQLRTFIEYKATLVGVPVVTVDPRNTSRECPDCGHVSKKNRPTRDIFICRQCGLAGPADAIAAQNIRARAVANQPMVTVAA